MSHYFAFVALVAVLVLIPGPAVILVMQKAVTTGARGALRIAAGVLAADLVWAAAAAAGVSALIVASEPAFLALRFAGAAYLIYLGARLLFAPKDKLLLAAAARDEGGTLALGSGSLTLYSLVLARAGGVLRRPKLTRRFMRGSGGILVGFGVALAAER